MSRLRSFATGSLLLAAFLLASAPPASAAPGDVSPDGVFTELPAVTLGAAATGEIPLRSYRVMRIDRSALLDVLARAPRMNTAAIETGAVIHLPMRDGSYARFAVVESAILGPEARASYPDLLTFVAQGIDDPGASASIVTSPSGLYVTIRDLGGLTFLEPDGPGNAERSVLYTRSDLSLSNLPTFECLVEGGEVAPGAPAPGQDPRNGPVLAAPSGENRTTYELGVSATGEFTQYFDPGGGTANTMANITASVAAVNAIYLPEVAIQFTVSCFNIYTDPSSDDFPNAGDSGDSIDDNIDALNNNCGVGNFDIGHVFHRRSGGGFSGLAGGRTCNDTNKARGYSSVQDPVPGTMIWVVDQLCHELGHQNSAGHTFNSDVSGCDGQRAASAAYEIGSGSTIMSYAAGSRCSPDLPGTNDAYFHTRSFDQITNHRDGDGAACADVTATGNTPPTVNAGPNYTIPRNTPFRLTATGEDADGHPITFCWEQFDQGDPPDLATNVNGPLFRSYPPTSDPQRTVPQMVDILQGNPTPYELLPLVDRTINFRCTVRDNRATGGGVNYDAMVINVEGDPFVVTSPNGGESLLAGCATEVTWDVGGGDVAARVNVLFSGDSGTTWQTLAENVLNDGSAEVTLPCVETTTARILVEAVGNIFFDVSDEDFELRFPVIEAVADEYHAYDPADPWTQDGLVVYFMEITADTDVSDLTFVADALQCADAPCGPSTGIQKISSDLVEFVPPHIGFLAAGETAEVEVKITIPVGQLACNYTGDIHVLASSACACPPTLEDIVPVSLDVLPLGDIDVDDNHENVAHNVLEFVGAKGDLVTAVFTVVNPNSDVKNVDKIDGPGNIYMTPVNAGIQISNLVKLGDPATFIPGGDLTVDPLVGLLPGQAQDVEVSLTVPLDSPVNAVYVGTATVTYEDCFDGTNSVDTFGIRLEVVPTMGPLDLTVVGEDSLYYCPPDPWTMMDWVEFNLNVAASGDHRNIRIASGGLRHESLNRKLDDFNFFPHEIAFLASGQSRNMDVVVKIPIGSPEGLYTGWFTIVSESGGEDSVEVQVEICPVYDLDIKDAYGNLTGNVMEVDALTKPNASGGEWSMRAFDIGLPADWINNHDEFDGPGNAGIDCVECEFSSWSKLFTEPVHQPQLHTGKEFTGVGSLDGDLCDLDSGEFRRTYVSIFVPPMTGTKNQPGTYKGRLTCWALAGGDTVGTDFFDIDVKLSQIIGSGGYDDIVSAGKFGAIPAIDGTQIYWGDFNTLGLSGGVKLYRSESGSGEYVLLTPSVLPQASTYTDTSIEPDGLYDYRLGVLDNRGNEVFLGPITVGGTPRVPALAQNFPNPFRSATQIRFQLPEPGHVSLKVYDLSGRLVRTLRDGPEVSGYHTVDWDLEAETGRKLAGGVYFYRLEAPDFTATKKMIVVR